MQNSPAIPVGNEEPLGSQARLLRELSNDAIAFGRALSTAFANGVTEGKRFSDVLKSIGLRLAETLLKAAFKPVELGLANLLNEGFKSVVTGFNIAPVKAFADGGVVSSPTYFGSGRNIGLMGERGAEAILPLARGADGRLGVSAGGGAARPASVTVNITTPDAESFRRAETDVAATLARAVARGQRGL